MNRDIKDIELPKTTKEFAQWLRDIATQVDRIPDRPITLGEDDVEVGFYYGNPMFPQMPTGLHFAVDFASTELRRTLGKQKTSAKAQLPRSKQGADE